MLYGAATKTPTISGMFCDFVSRYISNLHINSRIGFDQQGPFRQPNAFKTPSIFGCKNYFHLFAPKDCNIPRSMQKEYGAVPV